MLVLPFLSLCWGVVCFSNFTSLLDQPGVCNLLFAHFGLHVALFIKIRVSLIILKTFKSKQKLVVALRRNSLNGCSGTYKQAELLVYYYLL